MVSPGAMILLIFITYPKKLCRLKTNTNLFDFDAWWESTKDYITNGTVKRGRNQSFTITPTRADAFTAIYSSAHSGGYRIYVEPNSSYTWSWNKECTNSAYYGKQMIFLDGRVETGYMFTCTNSTSLTFTTKSDILISHMMCLKIFN